MPWTVSDPPSVANNWTAEEKRKCVAAANAVLRDKGEDAEDEAIFACIHAAGKSKKQEAEPMPDEIEGAADDAAKSAQKARSQRYGIAIREDGNVTKPSKWASVSDANWGDPVNYMFPVSDKSHAANAKTRFAQFSGRYDGKSRGVVRSRLNRLLRKHGLEPIGSDTENENEFDGRLVGEIFLADEELPDDDPRKGMIRIPAARSATFNHPWHGKIYLDEDLFHSFIDNWDTQVLGHDIAIDASHKPNDGALGWVKDIQVEDDRLVLYAQPTSKGKGQLGDVYRYASLWYRENFIDQETGIEYGPTLMGCAATNTPFVHRQDPISVVMSADEAPSADGLTFVYDNSGEVQLLLRDAIVYQDEEALTVSAIEESPADSPADEIEAGGNAMPDETIVNVTQEQPQAPSAIRVGDHLFTAEQIQEMLGRQLLLEKQLKAARVTEICDKALSRGVPPVVIEAARQVLMAAEMDAPETIELQVPTGDGQTKKVNYFGAVAHMLDMVPGRMGEITYSKGDEGNPPKQREAVNPYDPAVNEEMTLEQAEELARKRRKELGIKPQEDAEI